MVSGSLRHGDGADTSRMLYSPSAVVYFRDGSPRETASGGGSSIPVAAIVAATAAVAVVAAGGGWLLLRWRQRRRLAASEGVAAEGGAAEEVGKSCDLQTEDSKRSKDSMPPAAFNLPSQASSLPVSGTGVPALPQHIQISMRPPAVSPFAAQRLHRLSAAMPQAASDCTLSLPRRPSLDAGLAGHCASARGTSADTAAVEGTVQLRLREEAAGCGDPAGACGYAAALGSPASSAPLTPLGADPPEQPSIELGAPPPSGLDDLPPELRDWVIPPTSFKLLRRPDWAGGSGDGLWVLGEGAR